MRQGWTPEEDSYIRENFARLSDQQIADKLGRTLRSIQHRRKRLGIVKQPLSRWTAKEDQLIRGSIDRGEAATPLAAQLGRRLSEVSSRARYLGLSFRKAKGRKETYRGYRVSGHNGGKRVFEHTKVMEASIGRRLSSHESVHHINCNKLDNSLDNLYLCKNEGEHRSIHHSLNALAETLMQRGVITFNKERVQYELTAGSKRVAQPDKDALKARVIWRDSDEVIQACEHAASEPEFRTYWFCSIAMLRIGHVLQKYDASDDPMVSRIVAELWSQWKSDPESRQIFFDFLETERNQSLKEYEFSFYSGGHMVPVMVDTHEMAVVGELATDIYRPIESGPYAGVDARDVLTEVREWWDRQLRRVESCIQRT